MDDDVIEDITAVFHEPFRVTAIFTQSTPLSEAQN